MWFVASVIDGGAVKTRKKKWIKKIKDSKQTKRCHGKLVLKRCWKIRREKKSVKRKWTKKKQTRVATGKSSDQQKIKSNNNETLSKFSLCVFVLFTCSEPPRSVCFDFSFAIRIWIICDFYFPPKRFSVSIFHYSLIHNTEYKGRKHGKYRATSLVKWKVNWRRRRKKKHIY